MTELIDSRDTEHLLRTFLEARGLEHDPIFADEPPIFDALFQRTVTNFAIENGREYDLVVPFDAVETELAERAWEDDLIADGHFEPLYGEDLQIVSCPPAERPALIATIERMNWE